MLCSVLLATCGCAHPLRSCASTLLVIGPADLSLQCPPQGRAVFAGIELFELHGPDGSIVFVNPQEISSLRQPNTNDLARHFAVGTHCIVVTTNGKFVAATESCVEIRDRLAGGRLK